ncbi:MAG: acetyl-CoA hydrolase/transferase family protein [Deltaproteobacteria bacterium]|nr:acetyl-CoA hydrolase/transferase family protein [Deltaproteobacteria bacterium]MBK8238874.1 acetyl-CoA hydrolase/transferase family protein [Deltaproteobacteria bacterium]MBP7288167.1 acetyl-CoA hydrolase/transferase family protein [Nannocystaceae bacterium]
MATPTSPCEPRPTEPTPWRSRGRAPADVVAPLRSGMRVFVHGAAATPTPLVEALCQRSDLERVTLYHLHLEGAVPFAAPEFAGRLDSVSLFTGGPLRESVAAGRADFMPVFLSDIPALFRSRRIPLDAAIVQVSPPDRHGMCTLGTSVDCARAAIESAPLVLAEINERMPRTHGNAMLPLSCISAFCCTDRPLHEHAPSEPDAVEQRIGEQVANLIDDRSTLQMGIGAIPDAVLARLFDKHELGVHTEMFSDRLLPLVAAGVVTNRHKKVHPGRIVTSFVSGSRTLYDFVDDNPLVEFHGCDRTNDVNLIGKNERVVAINSALEIDLTGQVCADSIGHRIFSGIGGQMDFMHAAARSPGGRAIIALPSTAQHGQRSRIVSTLQPGAGVVTTRGHVRWIVTEWGAVDLHGMTLRERGFALISIAHPDFRAELQREFVGLRHFPLPST